MVKTNMRKKRKLFWVLLTLVLAAGALIYLSSKYSLGIDPFGNAATSTPANAVVDSNELAEAQPPPAGYVEYRNDIYGFLFYHSPQSKVTEYDEGQGAMTITLENEQKLRGLQIFIVPYAKDAITDDRFYADVPSGIRENIEETFIGKLQVRAVTFNSYDETLGDTREVWFIRNGLLFEVTTFKGIGDWFTPIMQTWRFTR